MSDKGHAHRWIDRARPGDAGAIAAIHVQGWREAYAGILPDSFLASLSIERRRQYWEAVLREPESHGAAVVHVVRQDDGTIVGFGACGDQRDPAHAAVGYTGEIYAVYVQDPARGAGLGRALMAAMSEVIAARAAERSGPSGLGVWVLTANRPARQFYARLGGGIVDERAERLTDGTTFYEVAYGWTSAEDLLAQARPAPDHGEQPPPSD